MINILLTRADRMGDLVLSTPVFEALRKKFPKAHLACLTFCENREIVEGNPFMDEVILYDKKGSEKGILGNLRFARKLASKRFDMVIHLHATHRMHGVGWLARIPARIGHDRKWAWALTHRYPDHKREGKKHEAEYNFDLLEDLHVDKPDVLKAYFPLTERARLSFEALLQHKKIVKDRPWIVLSPTASCPSKRWPAERFGKLATRIADQCENDSKSKPLFFAIGTLKERPLIEKLKAAAKVPIQDFSGRLSLGMLGVFLSQAALLISNDSGPVHVANAVGTSAVAIFGRNQEGLSPKRWGPLDSASRVVWKDVGCDPCLAHNCRINFLCLDAISVEDVLREVQL